ncbi:MAG: hypothetical protein ACKOFA_06405 [Rhodoluna sp.]
MFISNLLRSIVFAIAAAVLIFSQDHSVQLGATVLLVVSGLVGFIGLFVILQRESKANFVANLFASIVSLTLSMFLLTTNGFLGLQNNSGDLFVFRIVAAIFVLALGSSEYAQGRKADLGDRLEYRISASLGFLAAAIFLFAPLNDVNVVGFLSAYFALSAVQRGIWIATPGKLVNNAKK